MSKEIDKKEFLITYTLSRASVIDKTVITGSDIAEEAGRAWEKIQNIMAEAIKQQANDKTVLKK